MNTTRMCLSEALSKVPAHLPTPGCTRYARLAWGYRECTSSRHCVGFAHLPINRLHSLRSLSLRLLRASLSEAVWYPFNAWCRAAAGRGPRGRPQTSSYLNYYGRPLTLPSRTLQADCIRLYFLSEAPCGICSSAYPQAALASLA